MKFLKIAQLYGTNSLNNSIVWLWHGLNTMAISLKIHRNSQEETSTTGQLLLTRTFSSNCETKACKYLRRPLRFNYRNIVVLAGI